MKNGIVNELITAMKERIPKGQNLANSLADILYMGKEAVYRRLRGEVAFTIDEVALLSKKLGISIDQIIGNHLSNRVTFDMNLLHSPNTLESYYEIISRYQQIFDYVKGDDTTEVYTASNLLPFTLYSSYEYMSKFRLCRWIYQNGQMKTPNSLAEMQVEDIKYFASLNLITEDDVAHLKDELYQLLSVMETLSVKGEFSEGRKVSFYLSNIDFEATYTYIEKQDYQVSLLRVYSINSMDSQSPQICQIQRNWIQSLKRHSTLISESGEAQRIEFLQKQRTVIDTL